MTEVKTELKRMKIEPSNLQRNEETPPLRGEMKGRSEGRMWGGKEVTEGRWRDEGGVGGGEGRRRVTVG